MKNFETLEVGKTYKSRRFDLVRIVCESSYENQPFEDEEGRRFYRDGSYLLNSEESKEDLIELVKSSKNTDRNSFIPVGFLWRTKGTTEKWRFESDLKQKENLPDFIFESTEIKVVYEKVE